MDFPLSRSCSTTKGEALSSRKWMGLMGAVLLIVLGGFLTLFGLGGTDGGATSRSWATLGPIIAGFGVALAIVTARPS